MAATRLSRLSASLFRRVFSCPPSSQPLSSSSASSFWGSDVANNRALLTADFSAHGDDLRRALLLGVSPTSTSGIVLAPCPAVISPNRSFSRGFLASVNCSSTLPMGRSFLSSSASGASEHSPPPEKLPLPPPHRVNPPDSENPDPVTLQEQWRYATRMYSTWYAHAWGTAILAGLSFYALGWFVKGENPISFGTSEKKEEVK